MNPSKQAPISIGVQKRKEKNDPSRFETYYIEHTHPLISKVLQFSMYFNILQQYIPYIPILYVYFYHQLIVLAQHCLENELLVF